MSRLPRTGSYLIDSLLFTLEALVFTVAATLAVGVSALLLWATLSFAEPYTDSTGASTLLALLVFVTCIAGPAYLLVARTDVAECPEGPESPERSRNRKEL